MPSFKPEVKEALAKAGVTEDIKLTRGSLLKLIERDRQEFLPYIKETLENSDAIIKDKENVIIFAKDIGHTSYFTSVAKDNKGEWVITTNSYKTINQLKNRVNADGELLYLSKEAPDILAEAFTAKTFPSELESNSTTNLSKEQILNNLQDVRFRDTKVKETENDTITRNNHTDNTNNSNISNTNTLDSHLHTTPQGNERVMGDISTQSRVHREGGLRESQELSDIRFTDTKGKEHTLTKETQEQWLKTFGLENLEQSYIPKHSEEIKQALGGKEIRLQKGSLLKLVSQGREEFIPQIKAVLDEPDLIIKEPSEEILLAKHLKNEDYFVNVSFDNGEYLVSISNGIKETRNLQNKLNAGAKIIYQSPNANSISQTLLQTSQYSANKIDNVDSTTNLSKEQIPNNLQDTIFKDTKGKEHILSKQTQELGNPLVEFGTNYPEFYHNGTGAIAKLLTEKQGQVAGAFYKEGLGDIDLVWGDSSFGLQHILERRTQQWGEEKALRFISYLPDIIQESKVIQGRDGSIELLSPRSTIILAKKDNNHFMITAFRDSGNKNKLKGLENSQTFHDESFTSKSDSERNGTDILSQNQQTNYTTTLSPFARAEAEKQARLEIQAKEEAQRELQKEVKKSKIFYNKGFKGEEVAGASDILESGGTTTKPSDLQIKYLANHSSGINPKDNSSTKELSLSKAQAKKQEILNRVLTKKQEQLAKLEKQYQEAIAKENSRPIPPPNQSNNSRRAADRALSTRIKNLLSKIEDKKNEIILLDPNASKKEKYIAQRGQTYYNSMLRSYENFTKNKQVFLDKDIFKTDLLGFGINSNPQALREFRNFIEHNFNITPLKDFGTNYAEFYRDGQGAIAKILSEAKDYEARKEAGKLTQAEIEQGAYKGQVAGAFYKEELGDIDVVWGVEGSSKSDGWGLAKIAKYHPEVLGKLDDLIQDLPIVKETPNRYQLENDDYKIAIRKDFEGQSRNWVLTAFEKKESIARRRTDLPSTESATKKTTLVNAKEDSTTNLFKQQDIDFKSFEDFSKYAKLSGIEFESEAQAREAHKYIQSRLKDLEC